MHLRRAVCAMALVATACSSGQAIVGNLEISVPDGWQATKPAPNDLKIADGALGDQDAPGAARAVFDIYVDSQHTLASYRQLLEDNNVGASETELDLDGRTAYILEYVGDAFAGRQIAVVIPSERVHIVYRAARIGDTPSFHAGKPAFLRAVRSIGFVEAPAA